MPPIAVTPGANSPIRATTIKPRRAWGLYVTRCDCPEKGIPQMTLGDRFKGGIYYLETMDLFHLIDSNAKPDTDDLVVVERLRSGQVVVEKYHGQKYIGVVRALKPYQLRRSAQRNGSVQTRCCPN